MKRLAELLMAMGVIFCVASPAQAATSSDYLSAAVSQLQHGSIYIAPGTDNTDSTTAGSLSQLMTPGDNLVVVMLPSSASSVIPNPYAFAQAINKRLGDRSIVVLAIGTQYQVASDILPSGVADSLLTSAENVSSTSTETLQTFILNVHNWQAQNPSAPASKPHKKSASSNLGSVLGLVLLVVALMGGLGFFLFRRQSQSSSEDVRIKAADPVNNELEALLRLRQSVHDEVLRGTITQMVKDTEALFQRASTSGFMSETDIDTFKSHLQKIVDVLKRYIDVQNSPRYFDDPGALLNKGYQAISDFGQHVVDSIKRGGRGELTLFKVDTDILSAQKYSS